jgi:hypothetical protein
LEAKECARPASLYFGDLLHLLMTARIRVHDLDLTKLGLPTPD